MRASQLAIPCAAALAALGCSKLDAPELRPRFVEPARGYVGNRTAIVIHGDGFVARTTQSASGGNAQVDVSYRAWLGAVELEEVVWIDTRTLRATVPAGIPAGWQPLAVESPFGTRGTLEAAFEVVTTPGAILAATIEPGATVLSVGQEITLGSTITNVGSAVALDVTPAVAGTSSDGAAVILAGPQPASAPTLAPGESVTFTWSCVASAAGEVSLGISAAGRDVFSGGMVESPAAESGLTIQLPAGLVATIAASVPSANSGQAVALTFTVTNGGTAGAEILEVAPSFTPALAATCTVPTRELPAWVASGDSLAFTWTCTGSVVGSLTLSGTANGADVNSGAPLSATPGSPATIAIQTPAALSATIALPPGSATASVGQALTLTLTVANGGGANASVTAVTPTVTPAGAAACGAPSPAPPQLVQGNGTTAFTWTCTAAVAGTVTFGASVVGTDDNTGGALAATASPGAAATVQLPAALAAVVSESRAVADVGQSVIVTFTVTNGGSATAIVGAVTPSASGSAAATCGAVTPAPPQSITSGQARDFTWTCTPSTAGSLALSGTATGVDANSGAPLSATPSSPASVTVQTPAVLVVSAFTPSRTVADVGQAIGVTLTIANTGGATANVAAITPSATPATTASCTAASPVPPQTIPGGASLTFTWSCNATAAGSYGLGVALSATDANTGASVAPAPGDLAVTVQAPAALVVTAFTAGSASVDVGQSVALTLTLANGGSATANVSAVTPAVSPSAGTTCSAVSPASPQTIAGGTSRTFTWTCAASSAGSYALRAGVAATDANTGAPLTVSISDLALAVQTPAALTAAAAIQGNPTTVIVGLPLTVTLTVANGGGAGASVTAVTPTVTPAGAATCTAPSPSLPQLVAGGANLAFTWTCAAAVLGTVTFGATVAGIDVNTGGALAATAPGVAVTASLPAGVTATVGADRAVATVGQAIAVTFTIANGDVTTADITAVTPSATGVTVTCSAPAPAPPQAIAPQQSRVFTWSCTPSAPGTLTLSGTATGTNGSGAISATPTSPASVVVQTPPVLAVTAFTATRTTASLGQAFGLSLTLANGGGATASISAVTPTVTPPSSAACGAPSPSPPRSLAGGASITFTWSCTGSVAGNAALGATIAATDVNTGASVAPTVTSIPVTLQAPATLVATAFSVTPTTATVGQPVGVSLTLSNTGGATADVSAVAPTVAPAAAAGCGAPSPAPPLTIAGGASRTFTWTCTPSAAGTVTLGATAAGMDDNSGVALVPSVTGIAVTMLTPAALTASVAIGGNPSSANVGQVLTVTLTVTNTGGAGATLSSVTPTATGTAAATCGSVAPAPPQTRGGGGSGSFSWTCTPSSPGSLTLGATVAGADAVSGAALSAAASTVVTVQGVAALSATLVAGRSVVSVGQAVSVTLTVTNTGAAAATLGAVTPSATGTATATCGTVTGPALPTTLAGGASSNFTWSCTPSASGTLTLGASAAGTDVNSGAPLTATATPVNVSVQIPTTLSVTAFTSSRAIADTGQRIDLSLTVANGGGAGASVSAAAPSVDPSTSGTCTAAAPAPPQVIAGGASLTFTWSCTLAVAGSASLGATVTAADANSGAAANATATPIAVTIQTPATLAVTVFSATPTTASVNQPIALTLTLSNAGGATATVSTVTPTATPQAGISCTAAAPAPPQTVLGGGSVTFTWSCTATTARSYSLDANVVGSDVNTGTRLAPAVNAISVTVVTGAPLIVIASDALASSATSGGEVMLVAADALGDGTAAAFLTAFQGTVFVGPNGSGRWLVRLDPAGGPTERSDLALGVDAGPTPAANAAWLASAPALSIGAAGCAPGTQTCGPDDEAGVTVLAAGWMAGQERLLLAGAGAAGTRYLYATSSPATPLEASWVDLRAALPAAGSPELVAALFVPGPPDLLYLGYGAPTGPVVLALATAPATGGVDAVPGEDLFDLGVPLEAGAGLTALSDVGGVLYVAGGDGLVRSAAPASGGAWETATPADGAWTGKASIPPAPGGGWPRDRAVPALVGFGACGTGPCLYAARNVQGVGAQPAVVPQLWRCAPSAGPGSCAPGDWTLVAPDEERDPLLTRIGSSTRGAASVLAATPRWLYVAFDDGAAGVQLFRASGAARLAREFQGLGGCSADAEGCEGLGGNGFGAPAATRVFAARVLTANGVTSLWIAAGDGVGPVRVFSVDD